MATHTLERPCNSLARAAEAVSFPRLWTRAVRYLSRDDVVHAGMRAPVHLLINNAGVRSRPDERSDLDGDDLTRTFPPEDSGGFFDLQRRCTPW